MTARILSLCSGYLGLDMAVESVLDAHTVAVSDIDPGAACILAHRAPDVPNLGDVKTIHWADWAGVEIMTAGYPCQPFSGAGKRGGVNDPRHIFPYIADGIRRVGPRLVFLENVRGHLVLGFDVVLGALADIGYDAQWVCLRASDVGACHKRTRLFIVATPADAERRGWDGWAYQPVGLPVGGAAAAGSGSDAGPTLTLLPTPVAPNAVLELLPTPTTRDHKGANQRGDETCLTGALLPTPRATDGTKGGPNQRGSSGDLMMPSAVVQLLPTPRAQHGEPRNQNIWERHANEPQNLENALAHTLQDWSVYEAAIRRHEAMLGRPAPSPTETGPKGGARLSPRFVEWMMACPDGWVTDPAIGLTRNEQLKALGNGVVAPQAAEALRFMLGRVS